MIAYAPGCHKQGSVTLLRKPQNGNLPLEHDNEYIQNILELI